MKSLKKFKVLIALELVLALAFSAHADEPSLEQQLQDFSSAGNVAPKSVASEKLYSVQTRYMPLKNSNEITFGGAKFYSGADFLSTNQLTLGYRFHFSDRLSFGLMGSKVYNTFSDTGKQLISRERIFPDVAYTKNRAEGTFAYNVFYGKFRLSMDTVFYFDQYIALGAGRMWNNTGIANAAIADVGFAFWIGKWGVSRLGVKDYFYKEKRIVSESNVHMINVHADIGVVL